MGTASTLNPYAGALAGRDPLALLPQGPAALETALALLGARRVEQPIAPGKWSPRQIACHLADCEIAFSFRLRQALAEDGHLIQPFDQDLWARPYGASGALTAAAALQAYRGLRAWNVALLSTVAASAYEKFVTHPQRGTMTFHTLVETMAGHDQHHLQQLT
ncbi:MAG: DinB family protein [Terriglobales bacterium]